MEQGMGTGKAPPKLDIEALDRFLPGEFSQAYHPGSGLVIEETWHGGAVVRQRYRDDLVRPGGTISGPTMMMLADFAMYCAVLAAIGPVPLAVTKKFQHQFSAPARAAGHSGGGPADEARQTAGGGRGDHPFGWRG
jgi:acyl-coenzyme A thioesterase PaaI-like protein